MRSKLHAYFFRLVGVLALSGFFCVNVYAGNQKEEALADSVKLALSRAISGNRAPLRFENPELRARYQGWLVVMEKKVEKRILHHAVRQEFLETVWYEATRAGLDPTLVLALIRVESGFRKYAVSSAGARGYMQVMPFWAKLVGDGDSRKLFQLQANLRYGCSILRMYLDIENGNLYYALGRYNGSRGRPEYPRAVLGLWENLRRGT